MKSGALDPPRPVTAAPRKNARKVGFILPSFKEGSLFLRDADGQYFRLAWESDDPRRSVRSGARDRRRALPGGKYTLTGYRIVRRDSNRQEWFVSATSHGIRHVVVRPGNVERLRVSDAVRMHCRARRSKTGLNIQMAVQGEHHSGLSIYRGGKRIPIRYAVTSAQGKTLATGTMEYG